MCMFTEHSEASSKETMDKLNAPLLFCGTSNQALGEEIAKELGVSLGRLTLSLFPDGENSVEILEDVRGRDVFVLQSIALNPDFYLMELLIMIDALKRASAKSIIAIIPYYGYCRQDRKDKIGVPITAKLVANLLTVAGATRVITLDLHAGQLEGFFEIPVDHLRCHPLLIASAKKLIGNHCIVVAPDVGSTKVAEKAAILIDAGLAVIEKQRLSPTEVKMNLIGSVEGKDVLIADDMCSTGSTLVAAAELCRRHGAKKIIGAITHAICSDDAINKIENSKLDALFMTNSVSSSDRFTHSKKIIIVSAASLIAETMKSLIQDYQ